MRIIILRSLVVFAAVSVLNLCIFRLLRLFGPGDWMVSSLLAVSVVGFFSSFLYSLKPGIGVKDIFMKRSLTKFAPDRKRTAAGKKRPSGSQQPVAMLGTQSREVRSTIPLSQPANSQDDYREVAERRENTVRPKLSNGYRMPLIQKVDSVSPAQETLRSGISVADMLEEIHQCGFAIARLIRDTKERLSTLERVTANRMHLLDSDKVKSFFNARRITGALETRLERIKELISTQKMENLLQARKLLGADLVIPCDAVNSLINTDQLPSLPANQWKTTIETFLAPVEEAVSNLGYKIPKRYLG